MKPPRPITMWCIAARAMGARTPKLDPEFTGSSKAAVLRRFRAATAAEGHVMPPAEFDAVRVRVVPVESAGWAVRSKV